MFKKKFLPYNFTCIQVTGDTDYEDFRAIEKHQIIITTPEKWDSLCRRLNFDRILKNIRLVLLDEIHTINDELRGPVIESIVTRMKCMAAHTESCLRFITLSATVPNVEDISKWLAYQHNPSLHFKIGEEKRPVKLMTRVIGYECQASCNDFMFDKILNHKLYNVINTYSNRRPTLIFASTRKIAQTTAEHLASNHSFACSQDMVRTFDSIRCRVKDAKIKATIRRGVAFHHAGLDLNDRYLIENEFRFGKIPVLICTSTLSQGVNLPAHLVIIKGTFQYVNGRCQLYDENQVLQMIGRAGRPQYDREATAVIMVKKSLVSHFENFINGARVIESKLLTVLNENLNTEIYLRLITNRLSALNWIRSTYFFVRVFKNPKHYDFDPLWSHKQIEDRVDYLVDDQLKTLSKYKMIQIDEKSNLISTETGGIMASFCVCLDTMKRMAQTKLNMGINNLLEVVCNCSDMLQECQIRNADKEQLNQLNAVDRKLKTTNLRFPIKPPLNTTGKKINCLIQSNLGCVSFNESSLEMETLKIMKTAQRISSCLLEYLQINPKGYTTLLNAILLAKSIRAGIWEDSTYVSKQLPKIGIVYSQELTKAGFTTIESLKKANSRQLELLVNRQPPFGNHRIETVRTFPEYEIKIDQDEINAGVLKAKLKITVSLTNLKNRFDSCRYHSAILLVGDEDENILLNRRLTDSFLVAQKGSFSFDVTVEKVKAGQLFIHMISEHVVGIDKLTKFIPFYHSQRKQLRPIDPDDLYYLNMQFGE